MPEKIVIIVQARMSSSRLPGKVMLPILGKSLLAQMIRRLMMVRHRVTIVVATSETPEDDLIAAEALNLKVPCFRGSLDNLLDRHYQAAKYYGADVVLKIPSDCTLIDPRIVDAGLDYFFKHKGQFDYVSNLHPATWPDGNDVEIMTMNCLTKTWENASRPLELEHTTPYIWENPRLFRIGNITWETGWDYSMSHRFPIDYPADYEFINRVFKELYPVSDDFSWQDILDLLVRKPQLYEINSAYAGVNWYRHHMDELKTITPGQTKATPQPNHQLVITE